MAKTKRLSTIGTYIALILGSIVMIFPFIWMLLTAFKTNSEVMQIPPSILHFVVDPFFLADKLDARDDPD